MKLVLKLMLLLSMGALSAACDDNGSDEGDTDNEPEGDGGDEGNDNTGDVFDLVDSFGGCVNLGNWLEAPDQDWGVTCEQEDINRIAEMGFETIRVPIRWETRAMMTSPYTIEADFFELVDSVLDWSDAAGMNAVINMHHHDAFFEDAEGYKEMFLELWKQIAERYKERPSSVVFEIMNEPHDTLTADLWNEYLVDALAVIRESNPHRAVVIGTAEWGGIGAMSRLDMPADDPNLIFTFHYYEPFQFTHQGASWSEGSEAWLGTTWDATAVEKLEMLNAMEMVAEWADENDVPVFMGEFGAFSRADDDSRARWTEHLARYAEDAGFAWCYWEYKAGFGVWDPDSESENTFLTDALFNDDYSILEIDMQELGENLLENGDFEDGDTGWRANFYGGAATAEIVDGVLQVEVTEASENSWEIQYVGELPPIVEGQDYAIFFDAWSDEPRGLDVGIQHMADPWTGYGFGAFSLTDTPATQVINFTATADDDIAAFVLNLGAETGTVYVDNVVMTLQ